LVLFGNFSKQNSAFYLDLQKMSNISGNNCEILKNSGVASKKIDVVFVPCGYGSDLALFETDANRQIEQFSKFSALCKAEKEQKMRLTIV
jgi:hypothetical protein